MLRNNNNLHRFPRQLRHNTTNYQPQQRFRSRDCLGKRFPVFYHLPCHACGAVTVTSEPKPAAGHTFQNVHFTTSGGGGWVANCWNMDHVKCISSWTGSGGRALPFPPTRNLEVLHQLNFAFNLLTNLFSTTRWATGPDSKSKEILEVAYMEPGEWVHHQIWPAIRRCKWKFHSSVVSQRDRGGAMLEKKPFDPTIWELDEEWFLQFC